MKKNITQMKITTKLFMAKKDSTVTDLISFEHNKIRRTYDRKSGTWYFSVVDVVRALTDCANASKYWSDIKAREKKEGKIELSAICGRFKLKAPDGKMRLTDCANTEGLLRIIQSIPSPNAEPFKLWLAKVGCERIEEMADPEKAINRGIDTWRKQGRSEKWVNQRMIGIVRRNTLTDYWDNHGIEEPFEYAALTNANHQTWSGLTVKEHKQLKDLPSPKQNLRDHMTDEELAFATIAEISTFAIANKMKAQGFAQNMIATKAGGEIAKNARIALEKATGESVISSQNYLLPKDYLA
jgi:prophage antirepressor-like protein